MSRRHREYTDAHGRRWCNHFKRKLVRATLHEAWLAAFLLFVHKGDITTPYACLPSRWFAQSGRERRAKGCGAWHLTSKPRHMLPP